jgi:hypothetical protein
MDYFIDNSGNTKSDFLYKSFNQSQWDTIQKIGSGYGSPLKCLKKITS